MTDSANGLLNDKERFELILWNLEMLDTRRTSIANRAAIVLSADALLLAATTFLLDKIFSNIIQYSSWEKTVLALCVGSSMLLLVLSIGFATSGIANVWKTSRKMLGKSASNMPKRLFFHPTDTVITFKDYASFEQSFNTTNKEQMGIFALGEFWTSVNQHYSRYQTLRWTIRLLIFSIIPFLIAVTIIISKFFS